MSSSRAFPFHNFSGIDDVDDDAARTSILTGTILPPHTHIDFRGILGTPRSMMTSIPSSFTLSHRTTLRFLPHFLQNSTGQHTIYAPHFTSVSLHLQPTPDTSRSFATSSKLASPFDGNTEASLFTSIFPNEPIAPLPTIQNLRLGLCADERVRSRTIVCDTYPVEE